MIVQRVMVLALVVASAQTSVATPGGAANLV